MIAEDLSLDNKEDIRFFGDAITAEMEGLNRWTGCVAVVTGASVGIGAAICKKLVKLGINVVGMARRLPEMEEIAEGLAEEPGKFYPIKCDMRNEEEILAAFAWIEQELGGISIMVNNAGFLGTTNLISGDTDIWRAQFDVNVLGLCICTRETISSMTKHDIDGQIVHINSIVGHGVPEMPAPPVMNVYPATKHAVTALTESLRKELRYNQLKIKISSISPGLVSTEFIMGFPEDGGLRDAMKEVLALKSEDIAEACLYILSTPPHVQVHDIIIKVQGEAF